MQDEKSRLRSSLLRRRSSLSPAEVHIASQAIAKRIESAIDWVAVRTVHIYRSVHKLGEIDTQPIADWLAEAHPDIHVTIGQSHPKAAFPSGQFDVIFVPVVGFDRGGNRLGMGGGWYDRWLVTQPQATKIGLAYTWAQLAILPHEPHDIGLDRVVSDEEVIVAGASSR